MPSSLASAGQRLKNLRSGRGRQWGSRNRITRDLKQAVIDAAIAHGSDGHGRGGLTGYGFFLASRHPKAFSGLLGKLLPLQVDATVDSVVSSINIVSIPSDHYLGADNAPKAQPSSAPVYGTIEPIEAGHSLCKDVTRTDS
ncbi:hypothetical protein [Bradyrhizobium liaoningense]|uniref:hypothetical protein n=1 Tax=Bradyrhizobium liaoningense TaxID=43992 RepID=UPI001BA4C332|nr:hypothetical protein [Bradyrhizobium liaoningense]MBR0710134.1 hypothetical protein [Bradyrhizobium liaoningense]